MAQVGRKPKPIDIIPDESKLLRELVAHAESWPASTVRRCRIVLAIAEGVRINTLSARLACSPTTIQRTRRRWEKDRIVALIMVGHRTGRPRKRRSVAVLNGAAGARGGRRVSSL